MIQCNDCDSADTCQLPEHYRNMKPCPYFTKKLLILATSTITQNFQTTIKKNVRAPTALNLGAGDAVVWMYNPERKEVTVKKKNMLGAKSRMASQITITEGKQ